MSQAPVRIIEINSAIADQAAQDNILGGWQRTVILPGKRRYDAGPADIVCADGMRRVKITNTLVCSMGRVYTSLLEQAGFVPPVETSARSQLISQLNHESLVTVVRWENHGNRPAPSSD